MTKKEFFTLKKDDIVERKTTSHLYIVKNINNGIITIVNSPIKAYISILNYKQFKLLK